MSVIITDFAIYQTKFAQCKRCLNWRPNLSFDHLKMINYAVLHAWFLSLFHVFIGGGVLARVFISPGGGVLNSFFPEGGEFALQKNCPGDGQAWN